MRKTVKVVDALVRANYFLANSPDDKVAEREATANFLESLLFTADAYHGFRFLTHTPDGRAVAGDNSRRQYLVHRTMEADLKDALHKIAR